MGGLNSCCVASNPEQIAISPCQKFHESQIRSTLYKGMLGLKMPGIGGLYIRRKTIISKYAKYSIAVGNV